MSEETAPGNTDKPTPPLQPKSSGRLGVLLAVGILLMMLGMAVFFTSQQPVTQALPAGLQGILLGKARPLTNLPELTDHNGQPFGREQLKGRWNILFFGYTHCPDVCPTALAQLGEAFSRFEQTDPQRFAQTRGVFISVDPRRDSPEGLKEYVAFYHPGFLGATGDATRVERFAQAFKAYYQVEKGDDPDNYLVSHVSYYFVVSPEAEIVAILQPRLHQGDALVKKLIMVQQAVGTRPH